MNGAVFNVYTQFMRVLFIIPSITNYHTFLKELADELIQQSHEVIILAGEKSIVQGKNPYLPPKNCTWIKINFPRNFQAQKHISTSFLIEKHIKKFNPNIVHIHFSAAMFTSALAHKSGWPLTIATIHGLAWPTRKKNAQILLKRAELAAARKMDEVFVLNSEDLEALTKNGIPKCAILPGKGIGCNIDDFDPTAIDPKQTSLLRDQLGLKTNDFVFIYIGRQTHFKGFHLVVRAFMKLYHSKSNYKLLLLGDKDRIHPTGLNKTEESLLEVVPSIIHVPWQIDVASYLALSQVNVFPSSREGLPVNLMESLSMGVPIITNDSRGCRDAVSDGKNGFVLKENTVDKIAEKMKLLAENRVLLKSFGEHALEQRHQFNRKNYIKYQIGYYENKFAEMAR